jgi:hypothetical protein
LSLTKALGELAQQFNPQQNVITFHCPPGLLGAVAPPQPAGDILPDWYKKLPAVDPEVVTVEVWGVTVKRCMPFLDALTSGWVLTLPAEVHCEVSADGQTVSHKHNMPFNLIDGHLGYQVKGSHWGETPPLKFNNVWTIKTPRGWSCLFVPLLNRQHKWFSAASGLVDTDVYHHPVNLPFFMLPEAYGKSFTLAKGTPLVQVIPVKRSNFRADIREATSQENRATDNAALNLRAEAGWYRKFVRVR